MIQLTRLDQYIKATVLVAEVMGSAGCAIDCKGTKTDKQDKSAAAKKVKKGKITCMGAGGYDQNSKPVWGRVGITKDGRLVSVDGPEGACFPLGNQMKCVPKGAREMQKEY